MGANEKRGYLTDTVGCRLPKKACWHALLSVYGMRATGS
jgi:phage/plasmid-associated DNA primase